MRFERFAANYARQAEFQRAQAVQLARGFDPAGMGIDLGSGTGFMVQAMPNASMFAVDLSPAMLRHNPSRYRLVADGRRLPIASQSLDFGVSNMALQWMGECAEFLRVLKPGAPYRVSIVIDGSLPELANARRSAGLDEPFALPTVEHWQQQFESMGTLRIHQVDFESPQRALASVRDIGAGGHGSQLLTKSRLHDFYQALGTRLSYKILTIEGTKT